MKKIACLVLFSFLLLSNQLIAQDFTIAQPVRYLALGDSYTIGQSVAQANRWPVQLFDSLSQRGYQTDEMRIIAQTGWRTDDLRAAMNNANLDSSYNLVSLLIGVNNQFQGRTVASYIPEFEQLLKLAIGLAGGEKKRVFVLSIPDYAFTPYGQGLSDPSTVSTEIDTFNAAKKRICEQYGIRYFNITPISRRGLSQPNLVANDGLHPSGAMYTEWVEQILNDVAPLTTSLEQPLFTESRLYFNKNILTLASDQDLSLRVWDMNGKLLIKQEHIDSLELHWSFPKGTYLYELKNRKGIRKGKLVYF